MIVNKYEKYTSKNFNVLNNQDFIGRNVKTNLIQESPYESRNNLTKSAEMVQDTFNASNSLASISLFCYIKIIVAILFNRIV